MKFKVVIISIALVLLWGVNYNLSEEVSKTSLRNENASIPKELNSNSQQGKDAALNKPSKVLPRKTADFAAIKNEYTALNIPLYADELIPEELNDKENGAFYLRQTFELLNTKDESSAVYKLLALRKKGFENLSSEEKEQLKKLFNDPAVLKILNFQEMASRQEQHNWGLDYKAGFNMKVGHLTPMRRLHFIQELRIKHLLNSDNRDAALKAIRVSLKTARMTSEGTGYIMDYSQNHIISNLAKNIQSFSYDQGIYDILNSELESTYSRQLSTIDGERIFGPSHIMEADHTEILASLPEAEQEEAKQKLAQMKQQYAFYLQISLEARRLIEDPNSETMNKLEELERIVDDSEHSEIKIFLIVPTKSFQSQQAYQASLKMNLISQKLKEYHEREGQYPASLDYLGMTREVITDTLSDRPYNYELKDGKVSLSSTTDFGKSSKSFQLNFALD